MKLGKAATSVSFCIFLSRIFGLIRDQLFAALLGAGLFADAFVVAFRIPNLLRDLFAEGALSSAFVPTFTEYEVKKSKQEAWALANLVIGVLLVVVGTITLLGMIFTPAVVSIIAPGFEAIPGKQGLTVLLTRIMFPFLPIIAVSALFMGMLNVQGSFALPAFASVLFNIVSIGFGLALWGFGAEGNIAVVGWSIGTLCGGFAQGAIQIPRLVRLGWRFRLSFARWKESAGLRQIGCLMLPALIGLSATQINILVNTILASLLEQGSPSWLNYAFRLMQLPIGLFGVGISIVTLPIVSRDAALNSTDSFQKNLTSSLHLVLLLTIPCAVGLWVLGVPIIRLIFERGAFTPHDTYATASALACYSIGLPAYAAVKILAPAYYALKNARIPMIASILAVLANLAFNLAVYRIWRHQGLAVGTSIAAFTNLAVLGIGFQVRHVGLPLLKMATHVGKILLATALMALTAYHSHQWLQDAATGLWGRLIDTLLPISFSAFIYFLTLSMLKVPELDSVIKMVRRFGERMVSK